MGLGFSTAVVLDSETFEDSLLDEWGEELPICYKFGTHTTSAGKTS